MSFDRNNLVEFGNFRFDLENKTLWSDGDLVAVSPKAIEVLSVLIENKGNLVNRDAILDRVWKDTFVEDGNLNHAILTLRRALGDAVIQTVPRRGYRFVAPLKNVVNGTEDTFVIQRQTTTNTVIEEHETVSGSGEFPSSHAGSRHWVKLLLLSGMALILISGALVWFGGSRNAESRRSQIASIRSLAVLPLKTFSENRADEELRLRITDALITELGGLENIAVRPTNSVLRFAGGDVDATAAGRELNVDAIIDGRVQEENGRLRVTLQLVKLPEGNQLWSEQFDGRSGEILDLQDKIAQRFRYSMEIGLSENRPQQAVSNEAYEAYLKGRFLWNQRKKDSYFAALEYFERSVQIDPSFALGYTGISDCYHLLQQRNVFSPVSAFDKAEPAARRALQLDPQLAEAHVSMGSVAFVRYSKWSEAEAYYRKAVELNPNFAEPYARLGMLYNAWARFDEAHDVLKKAEQLDPTSVNNAIYLGANYYFSRQFDRAESQFRRILEFAPGTERAHFFLERIYEIQGKHDLAVEHALKEREISRPDSVEPLRAAFRAGGIEAFWRKQIEFLKFELRSMSGIENHIASRYVLLGEFANANEYIETNLKNFGTMHNYGRVDPIFDPLREDRTFLVLMNQYRPIV